MAFPGKCCRSTPRCRDCPARRPTTDPAVLTIPAELVTLLKPKGGDVPGHLAGVPRCLHKYEPLFRRRDAAEDAEAPAQALSAPPS